MVILRRQEVLKTVVHADEMKDMRCDATRREIKGVIRQKRWVLAKF